MAGGEHARLVPCTACAFEGRITKAERISEGVEDDHHQCAEGHRFGIDWSYDGPPEAPQWPPTEEFLAQLREMERHRR